MKIKYIKNNESLGIDYDLKLIEKEFKKLKIPEHVYQIDFKNLGKAKYNILLSERSTGKTTNILLLGLIFNKLYDTELVYIRQTKDMIAPSKSLTMFNTLIEYENGRYIEMLTNGEYNSVYYHWKQYFYCKVDEHGERVKTSEKPFMYAMSVDESIKYKSSFNNPRADFIMFDEFIGKIYRPNEFIDFLDLLKTIIRDRLSPIVYLMANTINVNSPYFKEFEISKEIKRMKTDTYKIFNTPRGTKIYVELAVNHNNKKIKRAVNDLFFGFKNPRMTSITGEGDTWAFDSVPHIIKYIDNNPLEDEIKKTLICKNVYMELANELIQLEFKWCEELGNILEVHPATKTYDDSIILTENDALNYTNNRISRLAHGTKLFKSIMKMYKYNKIYFSDNETGALFYNYIDNINR